MPVNYSIIYSMMILTSSLLAWRSGSEILQKSVLLMLLDYAGYSIVYRLIGGVTIELFMPIWSAFIVILIMIYGWKHKSKLCLSIIGMYWIEEAIHVNMFVRHLEGTYLHYALVNATFVSRMLIVWGAAISHVVDRIRTKPCRLPSRIVGV